MADPKSSKSKVGSWGTSLVVQGLRLLVQGGPGSIPGQRTRSHMSQIRVHMPKQRLKIPCAATKTWHSQVNKYFLKNRQLIQTWPAQGNWQPW